MKTWAINSVTLTMTIATATACSQGGQSLDKRGAKLGEFSEVGSGNSTVQTSPPAAPAPPVGSGPIATTPAASAPTVVDLPIHELKYPALKLTASKGLESIKAADVILTSKVSATDFVIFGKDGRSWSYKPEATVTLGVLKPIEAVVVAPAGATLYSLPDQQFWFVSADKLGRRKPASAGSAADEKLITVQQFSTKTFQGDLTKMKVLYVSADEIIFHLDSFLAILNVKTDPAQIKQLPIEKLPVDLKGAVQAGRTDNGYWFKANGSLYLLNGTEVEGTSPWSKGVLAAEPGDLTGLAFWPAIDGSKYSGTSFGTAAAGFFSDAPLANTSAKTN